MATSDNHSRLCIRRIASKSSLSIQDRHSRFCFRDRSRIIRIRLRNLIARYKKSAGQDYFTRMLPAELRLMIYEYTLAFDAPLKLRQKCSPRSRPKSLSILMVCRLTYKEALPVFYRVNAVVVHQHEFLRYPLRKFLSCKPTLVTSLIVCDLDTLDENCSWTATRGSLLTPSLLVFLEKLKTLPRLRNVSIDYHGHVKSIFALWRGLQRPTDICPTNLHMRCTGVGTYRLHGPWVGPVNFEFREGLLSSMWKLVMSLTIPFDVTLFDILRLHRPILSGISVLTKRYGSAAVQIYLTRIYWLRSMHDHGAMAGNIAMIWPEDLPMDLRKVEEFERSGFLHDFNLQLHTCLRKRDF